MSAVIQAPLEMVEAVASLCLPAKADQRLQTLMDRSTDGALTLGEQDELETLVELSETLALVRAQALHLLDLNHPRRALIRQAEQLFGLFP